MALTLTKLKQRAVIFSLFLNFAHPLSALISAVDVHSLKFHDKCNKIKQNFSPVFPEQPNLHGESTQLP